MIRSLGILMVLKPDCCYILHPKDKNRRLCHAEWKPQSSRSIFAYMQKSSRKMWGQFPTAKFKLQSAVWPIIYRMSGVLAEKRRPEYRIPSALSIYSRSLKRETALSSLLRFTTTFLRNLMNQSAGKIQVNVVPFPGSLMADICPWCASTIHFAIDSPSPLLSEFLEGSTW